MLDIGKRLLEQLQPLFAQTGEKVCARHIAARPREALRQARAQRDQPPVVPITMGIVRVASNAASVPLVVSVTITLTGMRTNSAASAGSASMIPFDRRKSSAIVLSLDITEVTNFFAKGSQRRCGLTGSGRQDTDPRHFGRLLRARRERPRGRSAAEQRDELASFHGLPSQAGS